MLANQREARSNQTLNSLFLWPEQFACASLKGTSTLTQLLRERGAASTPPARIHQLLCEIRILHLPFQGLFTDLRAIITLDHM